METIKKEAAEAARVEDEVKAAGLDFSSYTRKFRYPVSICGVEVRELTFEYGTLTGRDHIDAERDCLRGGRNCIPDPKYDGDFLAKIAVKACTLRDADGFHPLDAAALESLPIADYEAIRTSARNFFIVSSL